jgi:hypothetical protein
MFRDVSFRTKYRYRRDDVVSVADSTQRRIILRNESLKVTKTELRDF